MAQDKPPSKLTGWTKAALTSIGGLVSGAALMYLTPLVNNVIKPARPVANFAHQTGGLTVTINNRSTGGVQGWWDFGDGSALEPFDPAQDVVSHAYARPGSYNVKLSLQNLLGEESERTVAVNFDAATPGLMPAIESFEVIPLRDNPVAPATYRIISKVKNADLVVWGVGDDPLKPETMHEPDKFVTIKEPGAHLLRLVAFQGKQAVEKAETVVVRPGDATKPTVTLQVFYEGAMVQRKTRTETIALQWDAKHQGSTCPIARHLDVDNGWKVREARIVPSKKDELRNVKLDIVPDKTRVKLTAEIVKPKTGLVGKALAAPQCVVHVELTLERRGQIVNRPGDVVAFQANVPGMTTMPLPPPPPGMEVKGRRIALELKDGNQTLWGPGMPKGAQLSFKNRALRVSASDLGNELRIDVLEARPN